MQTIFQTSLTPEQYAEQEYHQQVKAPGNCPNCHRALKLEALAYYRRYITTATALVLLIWVRRFLCRACRVSVSCLPCFAQPYRVVNTPTVEAGFNGQGQKPEVQRQAFLIETYWQRFQEHRVASASVRDGISAAAVVFAPDYGSEDDHQIRSHIYSRDCAGSTSPDRLASAA